MASGRQLHQLAYRGNRRITLSVTIDGTLVLVSFGHPRSGQGELNVRLDAATGQEIRQVPPHHDGGLLVSRINPHGANAVSAYNDGTLAAWSRPSTMANALAISPDYRFALTGTIASLPDF